jgi:hypothetical protein
MSRFARMSLVGIVAVAVTTAAAAQSSTVRERVTRAARQLYGDPSLVVVFVGPNDGGPVGRANTKGNDPSVPTWTTGAGGGRAADPFGVERQTVKGDEATGVIVLEEGNELFLDVAPCRSRVATFVKPYRQSSAGTIDCNGTSRPRTRIIKE